MNHQRCKKEVRELEGRLIIESILKPTVQFIRELLPRKFKKLWESGGKGFRMAGEFRDGFENPLARFELRKCESEGFQRFFAGAESLRAE